MIQITNCPVCGHDKQSAFISCVDYTVSKETFNISSCNDCGFKFTNPIPSLNTLGDYYKSEEYISHSNTKKGLVSNMYHAVRNYTLKGKLKLLNSLVSRGTILDYGCGTGMFLEVCKKDGWNSIGIEPDLGASAIAKNSGTKIYNSKEELQENDNKTQFDAISLWHVLEHVVDLKNTVSVLNSRLKEKGVMIIALPNHRSHDSLYYDRFWAAYDLPRHLYHFDKSSISKLMNEFGYTLEDTKPMLFDSFYVSLLSEKYKRGSTNYLNAFKTGLISNIKALNSKEYSSHIYIFRKP